MATICAYHVVEQLVSIMLRKSDVEDPVVFDHIVPALFKYHEEGLLDSVLGILLEHMEDHEREPFVNKLMHAMGSLCRVASIIDLHSLDSSILPLKVCAPTTSVALAFVLALLNTPAVLQNWTESSGRFSQTIESLFFLKSPNQVDLRTLIPSTFWDKEHADAGECLSEAAAKQALVPIDVELRKVEHLQSQIALLLLGSSIRSICSLRFFLRPLIRNNNHRGKRLGIIPYMASRATVQEPRGHTQRAQRRGLQPVGPDERLLCPLALHQGHQQAPERLGCYSREFWRMQPPRRPFNRLCREQWNRIHVFLL